MTSKPHRLKSPVRYATITLMAPATTSKRGDSRGASRRLSRLRYEVIGVVLITIGLMVLLSLVSFSPTDTHLFGVSSSELGAPENSQNLIGTVGATIAAALFWMVGGGAYLLPFLLAMLGVRCLMERTVSVTLRSGVASFAALLFLSALLHLEVSAVPTLLSGMVFQGMAGGLGGELIAESLRNYFASAGAHIIVLAGLLVSLLLATPISLVDVVRRAPNWWESFRDVAAALPPIRLDRFQRVPKTRPKPVKIHRKTAPVPTGSSMLLPEEPTTEPILPMQFPDETLIPSQDATPSLDQETPERASPVSAGYLMPDPHELLSDPSGPLERVTDAILKGQSEVLVRALLSFGIEGKVTEIHPGPVVTMFEFEPAPGVKVARIVNLADDLALALKATSLRIVAPLPGKSVVGVEVPNPYRETVSLKSVLTSDAFSRSRSKLTLALGKNIFGEPVCADLKMMPHLLVAGATGSGKSVSLNTMLLSVLFSARPDEVNLLLIDPKRLELQAYEGVPHLVRPVITDPKSAARGLGWVVQEMERRYKLLAEAGVRNVDDYNRRVAVAQGTLPAASPELAPEQTDLPIEFLSEEARLSAGESVTESLPADGPSKMAMSGRGAETPPAPLPYILVVIDELADLMMVAPKEVEDKIARLAQMARASGIHIVLATQRPSVDVLTGLIKANFPARISFQVSSKTDSRTILDANGAEALLGRGDMLYLASGTGRIVRLHGSYVPDDDVRCVVDFVKNQAAPAFTEELQSLHQEEAAEEQARDEVYEQAKEIVLSTGQASASLIQRRLRVGYPRAARMIERMEEDGIVGAPGRDGRREVIVRRGPVGEELT
ncbi:MAG: DNA translocase FtsK 4TM domain-containing protein [Nitrospiraceae bacterium]